MKQIMDGCTAAAHVAYALSEIATIYPITPVASMGDTADKWALAGRKNIFGSTVKVKELESELGAAGAAHGALAAGALATTFTASQGLLLMIPNMFKISGELLPAVFHVGTRSLATHALSIFGDHQDVMACRTTGFAMLASGSVQETMDLAIVAHLAAIDGRVPVLHFFDGWRTSNELNTVEVVDYDTIASMVNRDAVAAFRKRAMNPLHPDTRGSAQDSDVYFQNREAANRFYDAFPDIVSEAMGRVAKATGRHYSLFDYYGPDDAEYIAVAMGTSVSVLVEASRRLNGSGMKTGVVAVRLFRPFSADAMAKAIPASAKCVVVLDRTKEPGSQGEPLMLDVIAALNQAGRYVHVIGGRYGLASKDFDPAMAEAVFENAAAASPVRRFTIGINDDVTHMSLAYGSTDSDVTDGRGVMRQCVFYGMGSDGTVGATRQAASILVEAEGYCAQAYFNYSAKKSGGYTVSQLRYGPKAIEDEYSIERADYVGCNKDSYVNRFDVAGKLAKGGIFTLNSQWKADEMEARLPAALRRRLSQCHALFYNVDAGALAQKIGLGVRINVIMETVFFNLIGSVDIQRVTAELKKRVSIDYAHEGMDVVSKNHQAIDLAPNYITRIPVPESWSDAEEDVEGAQYHDDTPTGRFVETIARPCMSLEGDALPVSVFSPDGVLPPGTTSWEKRCIAISVPQWDPAKCVECTECSLVCPHAAIRPVLLDRNEAGSAPDGFEMKSCRYNGLDDYSFRIQVYPADCTGCGSCVVICPGKALDMKPLATQLDKQSRMLEYARTVADKSSLLSPDTVPGTQMRRPLLEFSGACAGCGETPYVKLLTQLFGHCMTIANATGCSSIWGANFPSNAYCTDANGHGPAWGNSLFEDNAEYGFGIASAYAHRRGVLLDHAKSLMAQPSVSPELRGALSAWIDAFDSTVESQGAALALAGLIADAPDSDHVSALREGVDMLGKKSVWAIGGDGWAYDIGFAGLDHVLAQNIDINILVMDTECYSNTGGQISKATPLGAVMKYASCGKRTRKKDLGRMMMTYGNVYVAQISLGADYMQAIRALTEAEEYPGPSIVIAYCPCINHGIRTGMSHSILEEKMAVDSGYWDLYRYDPRMATQGKSPMQVDMKAPDGSLVRMLDNENRYADLKMVSPSAVVKLRSALAARTAQVFGIISQQAKDGY